MVDWTMDVTPTVACRNYQLTPACQLTVRLLAGCLRAPRALKVIPQFPADSGLLCLCQLAS